MASAKTGEMCPESSLRLAEALVLSHVQIQREEALGLLPGVDWSLQKRICLFFPPAVVTLALMVQKQWWVKLLVS